MVTMYYAVLVVLSGRLVLLVSDDADYPREFFTPSEPGAERFVIAPDHYVIGVPMYGLTMSEFAHAIYRFDLGTVGNALAAQTGIKVECYKMYRSGPKRVPASEFPGLANGCHRTGVSGGVRIIIDDSDLPR